MVLRKPELNDRIPMKDYCGIVFTEELDRILDHFAACFEIRIAYFSPGGEEIKSGLKQSCCKFCNFIRKTAGKLPLCLETDRKMFEKAAFERKLVSYKCHAGLNEAIHPIFIENELAGFLMIGQFRTDNECSTSLLNDCRKKGYDLQRIRGLFSETTFIPPAKLNHLYSLFSLIVNSIMNQRLIEIKSDLTVVRVKRIVHENIKRPISLDEVAKKAGRSKSTISHLFKKRCGMSFKEYLIREKLGEAEKILKQVSGISVADAGAAVGYHNQAHFSRLFKKFQGISPSEVKKK